MKRFIVSALLGLGLLTTGLATEAKAGWYGVDKASGVTLIHSDDGREFTIWTRNFRGTAYRYWVGVPHALGTKYRFALESRFSNEGCFGRMDYFSNMGQGFAKMHFDGTIPGHSKCRKAGKSETYNTRIEYIDGHTDDL